MDPQISALSDDEMKELADGATPRIALDGGNYATKEMNLIHLFLADGRELFSVDAHRLDFDAQLLNTVQQVYVLGLNNGHVQERTSLREKCNSLLHLIFD